MVLKGHIKNGAIVLEGDAHLPEGARVSVELLETESEQPSWVKVMQQFDGAAEGLPEDAAKNHDHYLYGTPKKPK